MGDSPLRMRRRTFLQGAAAGAVYLAAGCGSEDKSAQPTTKGAAPNVEFAEPTAKLSGDLKILMWSHFVPRHDKWFDPFAKDWGTKVGVNVTVDHIDNTQIPARIEAELAAGSGHDIIQYIGPLPQFEPSVVDLADLTQEAEKRWGKQVDLCRKCTFNPTTKKFFAYSPSWAPDPGDFRKSLWEKAGMPNGPSTYDELLKGGSDIKSKQGIQLGIGMSPEIDSNMAARALIWSFGGAEQDEEANVAINSPETVAAVDFMTKLYKGAMTQEVFAWNPASNNQGLIAGKMSYILNSISAFRTLQGINPTVADDVSFVRALKGPKAGNAAQHVMYNYIVPKFSKNVDAAKEFLLHYTQNWARVTWESQLYDFPAFRERVPKLDEWLDKDPFGSKPANKLSVLKDALDWSVNVGHPGYANAAIGEVFGTFLLPNMLARAARGKQSPQQAVATTEAQMKPIFEKWRKKGLIGSPA
jgi:ABC-type glycerol-3-phosphate transport system substrate-binding protein